MSTVRVAYLGPQGTYGHKAATHLSERLSRQSTLVPCPTIASVYSNEAEYLVMPLENTIHGSVLETIDCLLSPLSSSASEEHASSSHLSTDLDNSQDSGDSDQTSLKRKRNGDTSNGSSQHATPMIVDQVILGIQHCLVVRKGVKMEDIKWVKSHEQALGQCKTYLNLNLPQAKLTKTPSTAGAALSLLSRGEATTPNLSTGGTSRPPSKEGSELDDGGEGAAICSKSLVTPDSGLEILAEGIQDIKDNYTRFILLHRSTSSHRMSPSNPNQQAITNTASSSSSRTHTQFHALSSPSLITNLQSQIVRIHPRPALPFTSSWSGNGSGEREKFPSWLVVESSCSSSEGDVGAKVEDGIIYLGGF